MIKAETCCHLATLYKINIHNIYCVLTCESLLLIPIYHSDIRSNDYWVSDAVNPSKTVHCHVHTNPQSGAILRPVKVRTLTQSTFLHDSFHCNPSIQIKVLSTISFPAVFPVNISYFSSTLCVLRVLFKSFSFI